MIVDMNPIYSNVVLLVLLHSPLIKAQADAINVAKRIDLPSCAERFDVHRDTIIQTEDSRRMGAAFLYHVEVTNREDCRTVCCKTERCDVFVFEEKYKGTCFLFQCGKPDDFRCQFTAHANYTIAVLSPMQQEEQRYRPASAAKPPASVSPAVHLSQHEQELVSLKGGKEEPLGSYHASSSSGGGSNSVTKAPVPRTATTTAASLKSRLQMPGSAATNKCGRFQFQCHSGECIAVYNACDGIPQCEDGSDEGPECPAQKQQQQPGSAQADKNQLTRPETSPIGSAYNYNRMNQFPIMTKSDPMPLGGGSANSYQFNNNAGDMPPQIASSGGLRQATNEYNFPKVGRNREDPMTAPKPWPIVQQQQQQQQQQPLQQLPPQLGRPPIQSADLNAGGYSNDPEAAAHLSIHAANTNGFSQTFRDMYHRNSYGQQQQPQIQQQQPQQQQPYPIDANMPNYQNLPKSALNYPQSMYGGGGVDNKANNNWPTLNNDVVASPAVIIRQPAVVAEQQQTQQRPANWPDDGAMKQRIDENDDQIKSAADQTKGRHETAVDETEENDDEEVAAVDYDESDDGGGLAETTVAPRKGKSRGKHRKVTKTTTNKDAATIVKSPPMGTFPPVYQQLKAIGGELNAEIEDHDGPADRPGGAIVSLVIGVSLTAALSVLIACRMKTVSRRIRRTGKGPYAHDADFLVNGMYL